MEKHIIHPYYSEQTIRIGASLFEEAKINLLSLLKHHSKVFVWKPKDKTGVDLEVIEHRLNILPRSTLIKQKKEGASGKQGNQ